MANGTCAHISGVKNVLGPKQRVCDECIKSHASWVHLRTCQSCGGTHCCDSSPNRHASKHAKASGHPVVASAEPGERWLYCFPDEAFAEYRFTDVLAQITLRDPTGREVVVQFRRASLDDIPEIERLIALSARTLSRGDYSEEQIEAALGSALGVDSQLVQDGTYFVAETDGKPVICGGWSWRKTLFGGDGQADREPESLDPTRDAARIRAFFVHPDWARRGLGRTTLELCEAEARKSGFTSAELMATLPGERLYRSCGYVSQSPIQHTLPGGIAIRFVPMRKQLR